MPDYMVVAGVIAAGAVLWLRFKKRETVKGAARWMTLWRATWIGLFNAFPRGLIVGDWSRWAIMPVFYRGVSNILTVGPPGSMKGVGSLIPNALQASNLFLFDPGGEITAVCIRFWRMMRYRVYPMNPWGMFHELPYGVASFSFNPLDLINPRMESFSSLAKWLAEALVPSEGRSSDTGAFFRGSAVSLVQVLIMHTRLHPETDKQNLNTVRNYLLQDTAGWTRLIAEMRKSSDEIVVGNANVLAREIASVPKQFEGMLKTLKVATDWMDDVAVRNFLSHSDFEIDEIKKRKGVVIPIIVPIEFVDSHAAFTRLMLTAQILTIKRGRKSKQKVLMIIDEFPQLGKFDLICNGLATMRRYNLRIQLAVQNLAQLIDIYGQGWTKIEGNCELQQYLAAWCQTTCEHVSRKAGTTTIIVEKVHHARPLIMHEEVRELPSNQQIVFFGNQPPALLRLTPYWERPSMVGKTFDNPYHAATPRPHVTVPFQVIAGHGLKLVGSIFGPSKGVAMLVVAAVAAWVLS